MEMTEKAKIKEQTTCMSKGLIQNIMIRISYFYNETEIRDY